MDRSDFSLNAVRFRRAPWVLIPSNSRESGALSQTGSMICFWVLFGLLSGGDDSSFCWSYVPLAWSRFCFLVVRQRFFFLVRVGHIVSGGIAWAFSAFSPPGGIEPRARRARRVFRLFWVFCGCFAGVFSSIGEDQRILIVRPRYLPTSSVLPRALVPTEVLDFSNSPKKTRHRCRVSECLRSGVSRWRAGGRGR